MRTYPVDKSLCQASFDWQFVHEVTVDEQTDRVVRLHSTITLAKDPYMERTLGHYSSGLLLEIAKQIARVAYQGLSPRPGPIRYMVRELRFTFPAYTILDARCPVTCRCNLEAIEFRRGLPESGNAVIQFSQGETLTAEVAFSVTILSPEREAAIEEMFRDALLDGSPNPG